MVVLDLGITSLNQWVKIFKPNGIFFTLISTRFLAGRRQHVVSMVLNRERITRFH